VQQSFAAAAAAMPLPVRHLTHLTYLYAVLFAQKPMHPLAASNQDGIIAQYRKETGDATENKLILTANRLVLAACHDSYKTD